MRFQIGDEVRVSQKSPAFLMGTPAYGGCKGVIVRFEDRGRVCVDFTRDAAAFLERDTRIAKYIKQYFGWLEGELTRDIPLAHLVEPSPLELLAREAE